MRSVAGEGSVNKFNAEVVDTSLTWRSAPSSPALRERNKIRMTGQPDLRLAAFHYLRWQAT